jgi:putative DNA methylase
MELVNDDRRLIEDYLPIEAISAEASREKSVRKGHICTLHLWWARRPLVACRAAVYGALVPASQFVPNGGSDAQKKSLGRANAAKFIKRLCRYPGDSKPEQKADIERAVKEAQQHILKAHAERLSTEQGKTITVEDIVAGRAPRPRVLDMFAGGGAIPLEALRLGCEAYALDLNPVAHVIQLCTLVYPQKFGKPDPKARGMTGPKNDKCETTWGGLAEEVRYWGNQVLEKVRADIGDLYPLIRDPEFTPPKKPGGKDDDSFAEQQHIMGFAESQQQRLKPGAGLLTPVAYLWTRTVQCKNPNCGATVPLVRQTWLCKKKNRCVALQMVAPKGQKRATFKVVEAITEQALGFDPTAFSKAGNAICPFCSAVADSDYVMAQGCSSGLGEQLIAIVCNRQGRTGKRYLNAEDANGAFSPELVSLRLQKLCARSGFTPPDEPISPLRPSPNARGLSGLTRYGINNFGKLFTLRQHLLLLSIASEGKNISTDSEHAEALATYVALLVGRVANQNCAFTVYNTIGEKIEGPMGDKKVPMVWDFPETNPFSGLTGGVDNALKWIVEAVKVLSDITIPGVVARGDATKSLFDAESFDAIVTDPPYYDNVPYADISDFFYVWFKRSLGSLFPEHFSSNMTPKKAEATALASQHGGDMSKATSSYEDKMLLAFKEANRVLKPGGELVVVYAHKTTLGWSTLVDALREAGFEVTEAWPLQTEMPAGKVKIDKAMLASSIFLIARKCEGTHTANYEEQVRPELESIVRERVETLWDMGISGADLVIASVGAGLRAFTRFARVEYTNGEEVPAQRFLFEVETVVLETILSRLSKEVGGKGGQYSLASLDTASRFYVLWRYTYGGGELDAGEAIIFANGTHVELDGQHGLAASADALVEKKKSKYRLRDYAERGENDNLGLATENGQAAPLIDILHRTLWLMEKRPTELGAFLSEAQPNREQLRLVAQALSGPALKGGEMGDISPTAELSALGKLTANWQSVIENASLTIGEREDKKTGQTQLL